MRRESASLFTARVSLSPLHLIHFHHPASRCVLYPPPPPPPPPPLHSTLACRCTKQTSLKETSTHHLHFDSSETFLLLYRHRTLSALLALMAWHHIACAASRSKALIPPSRKLICGRTLSGACDSREVRLLEIQRIAVDQRKLERLVRCGRMRHDTSRFVLSFAHPRSLSLCFTLSPRHPHLSHTWPHTIYKQLIFVHSTHVRNSARC